MKERNVRLTNLISFGLCSLFLAGFQTSFLPLLLPTPVKGQLWIFLPIYVGLYHSLGWGIAYGYLATLLLSPFTNMPIGVLLGIHMGMVTGVHFLKSRIFWPTMAYYLSVSAIGLILYQFLLLPLTKISDPFMSPIVWSEAIVDIIIVPVFGSVLFLLSRKIDEVFPMVMTGAEQR